MNDNDKFEEWYKKNRLGLGEMPRWMEDQIREHYLDKWDMARTGMIDKDELIPGTNATVGDAVEMFKETITALKKSCDVGCMKKISRPTLWICETCWVGKTLSEKGLELKEE